MIGGLKTLGQIKQKALQKNLLESSDPVAKSELIKIQDSVGSNKGFLATLNFYSRLILQKEVSDTIKIGTVIKSFSAKNVDGEDINMVDLIKIKRIYFFENEARSALIERDEP